MKRLHRHALTIGQRTVYTLLACLLLACCCVWVCSAAKEVNVSSPDGTIKVCVGVKDNKPYYSVSRGMTMIVTPLISVSCLIVACWAIASG